MLRRVDLAMAPARHDRMRQWLLDLAPLVAAAISLEDARARLEAYVGLLDYPAGCFTQASLRKAGRRFRFFPAFAELAEFLDAHLLELREKRRRLELIAAPPAAPRQGSKPEPVSLEERQRVGALFGKLSAAIASGNYADVLAEAGMRPDLV